VYKKKRTSNRFDRIDSLKDMKSTMLFEHLMLQVVVNNVIDLLVLLLMKLNKKQKYLSKKQINFTKYSNNISRDTTKCIL
jgi:hypothetical protein